MISPFRKRIVVVGAGGRLGKAFVSRYQGEHDVICLNHAALDLADPASIAATLKPLDYDLLILPGALTAVDYCETHQEEAFAVNSLGPKLVAEISAGKGAHVTYISTDFVFDGLSTGPYDEHATPNPLSVYGASKLEGEENILTASRDNLVVRVSWVYGPAKPAFPEWIIGQAMQQAELALPAEKIGSTTYTPDVAEYLRLLLGLEGGPVASGVFHFANTGVCTWQQWGQHCLDAAANRGLPLRTRRISGNRLEDIKAFVASRPINSVLSSGKFQDFTGVTPRPWQEAMADHFAISPLFEGTAVPA